MSETTRAKYLWVSVLSVILVACAPPAEEPTAPGGPELLGWSEQIRVREEWLEKRYEMLLPLMRNHDIDMWIVVNEEFHDDPLTEYVAPPRPYVGGRDIFVFLDTGDDGLKRIALVGFEEESLARFFEMPRFAPNPDEPRPSEEVLKELYEKYRPQRIGLAIGGGRGVTRSLTHDGYVFMSEALGTGATERFVPAHDLIEEFLDTRIPEEMPHYQTLVHLTEVIARRAFSNEVVKPGSTTVGDIRRWLYDAVWEHGVTTWFQPDLRVQRKDYEEKTSRGFLAVAEEDTIIQRGDVLHVDFGVSYMGFDSDWQKMAYVLREGEEDAPQGLKKAMANTNALQDALIRVSRPGKTAAEVYDAVMAEMAEKGIRAQVYSHPLGNHGHGLGASIDFRSAQKGEANRLAKKLREGSYLAMELNTRTPVPEWNDEEVYVMLEDPVYLTEEGWKLFRPRQEAFYLIR